MLNPAPPVGDEPPRHRTLRPRKACVTCRKLKTRCLPRRISDDLNAPCARCTRLRLACEYNHLRRGPPKGFKRQGRPQGGDDPSPGESVSGDMATPSDAVTARLDDYQPPDEPVLPTPSSDPLWLELSSVAESTGPSGSSAPLQAPGLPTARMRADKLDELAPLLLSTPARGTSQRGGLAVVRPFYPNLEPQPAKMQKTLETYLEPRIGDEDSRLPSVEPDAHVTLDAGEGTPANVLDILVAQPHRTPTLPIPDPVGVGLLSEPEAQWLFSRFAEHVSPSSHIFDHAYHTYERVRRSPVLFTAVMYAAARFFRPQLADWCLDMAETGIARAMRNADVDLPLVQALLTLVYWKRPKDPTAYYKLGLATRCICQLGVKWQIDEWDPSSVGGDEDRERAKVDAERVAYTAFGMDNSYGVMFRLPSMGWPIPPARKLRVWAENHAHLDVTGDFFKVFLTECWEMHQEIGEYSRPPSTDDESVDELTVCSMAMEHVTVLAERWLNDPQPTGVLRLIMVLIIKMMLMKRHVVSLLHGLSTVSVVLNLFKECADVVVELVSSGEVIFLSDMSTVSLSVPVLLAFHARNEMTQDHVSRTISILRTTSDAVDRLTPLTGDDHPLRYVQRCHHRVLSALERFQPNQTPQTNDYQDVLAHLQQLLGDNWTHAAAPDLSNDSAFLNDPFWLYPTHVV